MRERRRGRWQWACALVALASIPACGAGGTSPYNVADASGGGPSDAGISRDRDASSTDAAAPPIDASGTPPNREDSDVACADFRDENANGAVDCADDGCRATAVCCVGSTSPQCCVAPTSLADVVDLASCSSTVVDDCVSDVQVFGRALPILTTQRDGGAQCSAATVLAPQGDATSDGGLLAARLLDTSSGVVALEARVGVSPSSAPTLDAIGVGLTDQTTLPDETRAHVRPIVALVVSATDQVIRTVAGDITLATHPLAPILGGSLCPELELRIVTRPSGSFDTSYRHVGDGTWIALDRDLPFQTTPIAQAVAYGRSTNPGAEGVHAWLGALSVDHARCDVLDPIRSTTSVFADAPTGAIHSVSRVGHMAVYESGGDVYAAGVDGAGQLHTLARPGAAGDRILITGEAPFFAGGLADPELVPVGENLRLFFTAIDGAGRRSIGYLDFDAELLQRVTQSAPRELVPPDAIGALGVDGPTYFETSAADGPDGATILHRYVVFRALLAGGASELRAAELDGSMPQLGLSAETRDADVATVFFTSASPLEATQALYANRASVPTAFDADEIAAPEIVVYRGIVRVFFAARRGARWSIGMLRSPDFRHFELAYPEAVLAGTGVGFDAVSVSDPDAVLDATSGSLTLYYTASDGTTVRPGLATQQVIVP